ncbi:MAG TPA: vWA domain-containing protein [Acidimicrobiales bacterium]|nr:vWA domain-containing protein [Acidimicrobiales bacterium]
MDEVLRQQDRRTLSRAEMQRRHEHMSDVSPEVGALDEAALAGALEDDLDEGVSLLVDLTRATDPRLRERARRVASSLVVPAARVSGPSVAGGSSRLGPVRDGGVDLDLDATLEQLGETPQLRAGDLRWRGWRRPGRAVVLLIDASGSVTGPPLTTAVVTAAALAARSGPSDELAVVAFWSRSVVLRHMGDPSPASRAVDRVLALRGGDTTDLAGGLTAALSQMALATAGRRDVIVLTDGMANEGGDPLSVAASAAGVGAYVHVLALSPDEEALEACQALAAAGGGRLAVLERAAEAPAAVASILA